MLAAEQHWERRWESAELSLAIEGFNLLTHRYPADPVGWTGLSRGYQAMAYGFPEQDPGPLVLYEKGREVAWRCLLAVPAFEATVARKEGLTWEVARQIPQTHHSCLDALVAAWVRWAWLRDPAAVAIDMEEIGILAARGLELGNRDPAGPSTWNAGLAAALPPPGMGRDLIAAERHLRFAVSARPADLTRSMDLVEYVLLPAGRVDEALALARKVSATTGEPGPYPLENRVAAGRAHAVLAARKGAMEGAKAPSPPQKGADGTE